jgi:hypothetical protein
MFSSKILQNKSLQSSRIQKVFKKRFLETFPLSPILMPISLIYLAVMCFGRKDEQREGRVYLLLLMDGTLLQNMEYIYLLN